MLKNYLLFFLIFNFSASFAQIKIGVMGGPQSASILEKNDVPNWDATTGRFNTNKAGFHLGIMAEIPISANGRFCFEPSVLYSQKGNKYSKNLITTSGDSTFFYSTKKSLSLNYIDVPLNLAYKWRFSKGKLNSFVLSAGPYISFFSNGSRSINQNDMIAAHTSIINITENKKEAVVAGNGPDTYRSFGYGLNGRAGVESNKIILTAFYSQGLDNLYHASYQGTSHHKVFGVSLGFWLASFSKKVTIKDQDHDGIPDHLDACPLQAGRAIAAGCPDMDGDGIIDNKDMCPGVAGSASNNGCPEGDINHDGVVDEKDGHKNVADSTIKNDQLPADSIHEELVEEKSITVDTTNNASNNDSLANGQSINGLENISNDKILFSFNSASLNDASIQSLKKLINFLQENPTVKLNVDGYTDNIGGSEINILIATERANAIKGYLVKKGIAPGRISIKAFGNTNPIADNKTKAGRAKNRRVELKIAKAGF